MTQTFTGTLADLRDGDEILKISNTPADRVTVGIQWTDEPQRLVVTSAKFFGEAGIIRFANGGFLPPCALSSPCVISRKARA
jgi:hypothetical protein